MHAASAINTTATAVSTTTNLTAAIVSNTPINVTVTTAITKTISGNINEKVELNRSTLCACRLS